MGTHVTSLSAVKSGTGYFYIGLGTNATPVTPDDYAWDNDIADLTHNSWSLTTELKDGRKVMRFTETVTNNTDTDITVSEVGIIVQGNGTANTFLIAREVLDTPITVKAKYNSCLISPQIIFISNMELIIDQRYFSSRKKIC